MEKQFFEGLNTTPEQKKHSDLFTVKYNKEKEWFMVYTPSGEEVKGLMQVSIDDNFDAKMQDKEKQMIVTFKACCNFDL
jgi:hypothetical protein